MHNLFSYLNSLHLVDSLQSASLFHAYVHPDDPITILKFPLRLFTPPSQQKLNVLRKIEHPSYVSFRQAGTNKIQFYMLLKENFSQFLKINSDQINPLEFIRIAIQVQQRLNQLGLWMTSVGSPSFLLFQKTIKINAAVSGLRSNRPKTNFLDPLLKELSLQQIEIPWEIIRNPDNTRKNKKSEIINFSKSQSRLTSPRNSTNRKTLLDRLYDECQTSKKRLNTIQKKMSSIFSQRKSHLNFNNSILNEVVGQHVYDRESLPLSKSNWEQILCQQQRQVPKINFKMNSSKHKKSKIRRDSMIDIQEMSLQIDQLQLPQNQLPQKSQCSDLDQFISHKDNKQFPQKSIFNSSPFDSHRSIDHQPKKKQKTPPDLTPKVTAKSTSINPHSLQLNSTVTDRRPQLPKKQNVLLIDKQKQQIDSGLALYQMYLQKLNIVGKTVGSSFKFFANNFKLNFTWQPCIFLLYKKYWLKRTQFHKNLQTKNNFLSLNEFEPISLSKKYQNLTQKVKKQNKEIANSLDNLLRKVQSIFRSNSSRFTKSQISEISPSLSNKLHSSDQDLILNLTLDLVQYLRQETPPKGKYQYLLFLANLIDSMTMCLGLEFDYRKHKMIIQAQGEGIGPLESYVERRYKQILQKVQ